MAETLAVAKFLNNVFKSEYGTDMDEMRMHKLMYFSQRESLMYNKSPLFDAEFHGWKYGPVLSEVRAEYKSPVLFEGMAQELTEKEESLVKSVYDRYKSLSTWKLSSLSHGELSWKNSREGLAADEKGDVTLKLSDMRLDAARELMKRKLA